jgi:cysteine desulfurase
VLSAFKKAAVSPFEHSSVLEPAKANGFEILGNAQLEVLPPTIDTDLLSVMRVNNEIGTIFPTRHQDSRAKVHSDLTQAVGKVPTRLENLDFASCSSHKLYGPKGVGALFYKEDPPKPLLLGGEQELGIRGGTLNVAGIVGFGAACAISNDEEEADSALANQCRSVLLDQLSGCTDWQINGGAELSPYILSISFLGLEGETLVVELDSLGYAISSGAACSSRSTEPSHVLQALGIEPDWSRGTVRISFGRFNNVHHAEKLGTAMTRTVENLRRFR